MTDVIVKNVEKSNNFHYVSEQMKKITYFYFILTFSLIPIVTSFAGNSIDDYSIHINRVDKTLYVLKSDGTILWQAPCGIGRGGIKQKRNMNDNITPTGAFSVDLILYKDAKFDVVSEKVIKKYKDANTFYNMVSNQEGLNKLFANMNGIDFNKDSKSDNAYGIAYIGLDSNDAVTGPKLKLYSKNVPHWFSIAIHGTPDENNVGEARSGGCIHLGKENLSRLIENGIVKIGTSITIADSSPKTN